MACICVPNPMDQTTLLLLLISTGLFVLFIINKPEESLIGLSLFATQTIVLTGIFLYHIPQ